MAKPKSDIKQDIEAAKDRGETTALMEPLLIRETARHRAGLTDLAFDLAQRTAGFRRSLPASMVTSLANLVRTMNCYYSNIIEGRATHPVDIERALKGDYSDDAQTRNLQLEAKAHITVQQWIDAGGLKGRVVDVESIREIHRRFCEHLPADLLSVEDPATKERVKTIPGALRTRDVQVGRHVAISPGAVPRFLSRFQEFYGGLGPAETVIAAAAAHHRLAWIHPFLDGNGRVARLLSPAPEIGRDPSRGLLPERAAARRRSGYCGPRRAPSPPHRLCAARPERPHIRQHPRAAASGFSRGPRTTMDAGPVS